MVMPNPDKFDMVFAKRFMDDPEFCRMLRSRTTVMGEYLNDYLSLRHRRDIGRKLARCARNDCNGVLLWRFNQMLTGDQRSGFYVILHPIAEHVIDNLRFVKPFSVQMIIADLFAPTLRECVTAWAEEAKKNARNDWLDRLFFPLQRRLWPEITVAR